MFHLYPDKVDDILRTWKERSVTVLVLEVRKLICEGYGTLKCITADSLECKRVQVYLLQLTRCRRTPQSRPPALACKDFPVSLTNDLV
jgi:hypothetical protein